jgi:hypothetical protein
VGFAELSSATSVDSPYDTQSINLPVMEPLPGTWQLTEEDADSAGMWPLDPAEGGPGQGDLLLAELSGAAGLPGRARRGRPRLQFVLIAVALVIGGTAAGLIASKAGLVDTQQPAANTSSPGSAHPRTLLSVLANTSSFTGDLKMSTCAQHSKASVVCTGPAPGIASVTFVTFSSLKTLYLKYTETVAHLAGMPFSTVTNMGTCSAVAPDPADESTWNHSYQEFTTYSVAQMLAGKVSDDMAMGRVFCVQTRDGSEDIVWTQDSGHLLGYATGGNAAHEIVWNWFDAIHHNIIFPGQTGMAGMTMTPATTTSGSGMPSTSAISSASTSAMASASMTSGPATASMSSGSSAATGAASESGN